MKLRTCEFCGTEYDETLNRCPLCGKSPHQSAGQSDVIVEKPVAEPKKKKQIASTDGARVAGKEKRGASGNKWAVVCALLGAAVLAGLIAFLYVMGLFGNFSMKNEPQTPVEELPEYNYENQLPEEPVVTEPEEPVEEEPEEVPEEGACTALTISQEEVTLEEAGDKMFLTAVARPSDCKDPIEFFSSDETVATVNGNGMITAIGPGTAQIIVTCGDMTEACTVICTFEAPEPEEEPEEEQPEEEQPEELPEEEPAKEPTLSTEDFTLFYPGEEAYLTVNDVPEGAAVSYVSSNAAVVTVTNTGKVTAVGSGTATITVTVGETKLTCVARCNLQSSTEDGTSTGAYTGPFTLSHTDVTLFSAGEAFSISLVDAAGKKVNVGWFASNGSVSITGSSVKAVSGGMATVSCVYNGQTYSCIVRCSF